MVGDIEHKKNVYRYMVQEFDSLPKDINRNQYLKRINEIIKQMKDLNKKIRQDIKEVEDLKSETTGVIQKLKKID